MTRTLAALTCALVLTLGVARSPGAGEPDDGYRLGVFPYVPALAIDRVFGPIAASLAKDIGTPVYLKTKSTFEKFAEELVNETYDIIFVHPFFYVDAADSYVPLARLNQKLTAVVMVGEDRDWQDWRDLAGKTVALPPELSAVSELVKAALLDAGLQPGVEVSLRHFRTKTSCLQAVVIGAADACAVPRFILSQIESVNEMPLRVMMETAPINHFLFAVHRRVPAADRDKLLQCILSWPQTADGRATLSAGGWSGFVVAQDADYDEVRRYKTRLRKMAQK